MTLSPRQAALASAVACLSAAVPVVAAPIFTDGPRMVADINTGTSYNSNPDNLTAVGNVLYFRAFQNQAGYLTGGELWRSDGTEAGTYLVKDINPTTTGVQGRLIDVNGTLYFNANDGTNGTELWKSDGTAAGTVIVQRAGQPGVRPGNGASLPNHLTVLNGQLYFSATDGSTGRELYTVDPTSGQAVQVVNLNTTNEADDESSITTASGANVVVVNGRLYFSATEDKLGMGYEVYSSNGVVGDTSGTGLVVGQQLNPGSASANGRFYKAVGDKLFFLAEGPDGDGREMWVYNTSTPSVAPQQIDDIAAGSDSAFPNINPADPTYTAVGDNLYFVATDITHGEELWVTSLTNPVGNARRLTDIDDRTDSGGTSGFNTAFGGLIEYKDYLYFSAAREGQEQGENTDVDGNRDDDFEIYRTNTQDVIDNRGLGRTPTPFAELDDNIAGRSDGSYTEIIHQFLVYGDLLWFVAEIDDANGNDYDELWTFDGTSFTEVNLDETLNTSEYATAFEFDGFTIRKLTVVGDKLFFTTNRDGFGEEIWTLTVAVPEPASLALLALGTLVITGGRLRLFR